MKKLIALVVIGLLSVGALTYAQTGIMGEHSGYGGNECDDGSYNCAPNKTKHDLTARTIDDRSYYGGNEGDDGSYGV